jgi:RNA polymerase sigma factor (sigma-70 family)
VFETLIESKRQRQTHFGAGALSLVAHTAIIAGAVIATTCIFIPRNSCHRTSVLSEGPCTSTSTARHLEREPQRRGRGHTPGADLALRPHTISGWLNRLQRHMGQALFGQWTAEQDQRIAETVRQVQPRLRNFIRKHVADEDDAEDVLQEVFYELVEAYRLMKPVEQVGAWLYRVARNRIIDRFRKKKAEPFVHEDVSAQNQEEVLGWEDLLPSPDGGPEAVYARSILLDELDAALGELPEDQRDVFIAHEVEGRSFKDLAAETGVPVNTLLSRKHYAVVHLRRRLQAIYDEFTNAEG